MATAVQIEVRVDDTGVTAGLNKVQGSFKQLSDAVKQAMRNLSEAQAQLGAAAEAGSAQAKKVLQEYEGEVQRAQAALTEYSAATEAATTGTSALTGAVERQVPQMAAASAAVRLLEGNTQGSIRAAERFLSTTLNLGPALQAAFPVIGALAFLGVIEHVGSEIFHTEENLRGMTAETKAYYDEVVDGSRRAFLAVGSLSQGYQKLSELNIRDSALAGQHDALQAKLNDTMHESVIQSIIDASKLSAIEKQQLQNDADRVKIITQMTKLQIDQNDQKKKDAEQTQKDDAKQQDEMLRKHREVTAALIGLQDKAAEGGLTGVAKLAAEENAEIDSVLLRLQKLGATTAQQMQAVADIDKGFKAQMAAEQAKTQEEFSKEVATFENDQYKQTTSDNKTELDRRSKDTEKAVRDTQHMAQQQARDFQQYTQQLGNDLYQMFNEITSGNIGKLIKEGFTRLFANILAQWIATVQGIGNVSRGSTRGGASGLLGSLLGSILGIGGGGGATAGAGTGPYGLPAGVASSFTDFGDFGGPNATLSSGAGGIGPFHGDGSLNSASIGGDIGGSILGSVLNSPVGGVSSGVPQKQGGPLAGLLSGASLAKLGPLAVLSSLMLASKGGVSAAAGGALIGALGLGALYSSNPAIWMAAAPYAGLLGPLAGGLIGFGVGSATGSPTLGGLSGAGSGALIGLAAAGPIGALIGGIVGGLAGLFGGLFGGGPSKHTQADRYINANILPAIQQELTNFEGFSTDYATAINDLDQLKSQTYTQMKQQFGTDATNDEWSKYVVPAVQQAEDRINADQAERNRRGSLVFGAPQFADGGLFTSSAAAGFAILHDGETVMTRAATQMYGPLLNSLNAASKSGTAMRSMGGEVHLHIHSERVDENWLRNDGIRQIANGLRRMRMEGHSV